MSPFDQKSVTEKLFKLQEAVKIIEELVQRGKPALLKDKVIGSAVKFNLLIAIEIILDVGNHILAEHFDASAKTYRDIVISLGTKGVIPATLAEENKSMADFRNKMIHDYDRVDDSLVYDYAEKAPAIFRSFVKSFVEFTEKK